MSITKNRQSPQNLYALCSVAFPDRCVAGITELTEGMFNAAYRIDFTDGGTSVLKIAAADSSGLMRNEINLMHAEVAAMQLLHEHSLPYVARVQHADFTHSACSGDYFFMECLPGRSLSSCRSELPAETIPRIHRTVGQFQKQLSAIAGEQFGLLGDPQRFSSLYGMMRYMFLNVLDDAASTPVGFPFAAAEVLARLDADHAVFDEVKHSTLVHWDMWEGNIFVQDGRLSGVIDWERAMWGEPFMDDRFRSHNRSAAFLDGYGQTVFSAAEQRRLAWYDLFLYMTMMTECFFRQYDNISATQSWLHPLLEAAWAEICRPF